jgi:hypothetical protein
MSFREWITVLNEESKDLEDFRNMIQKNRNTRVLGVLVNEVPICKGCYDKIKTMGLLLFGDTDG